MILIISWRHFKFHILDSKLLEINFKFHFKFHILDSKLLEITRVKPDLSFQQIRRAENESTRS